MALIYNYYEAGIPTSDGNKKYKCLVCVSLKEKAKDGSDFYSLATGTTTSNLINHMKKQSHSLQYEEYLLKIKANENKTRSPVFKKQKLNDATAQDTPKSPSMFGHISNAVKYAMNSLQQKLR